MIQEHPFAPVIRKILAPDLKEGNYAVVLVDRRAIGRFMRLFADIPPPAWRAYFSYSLSERKMRIGVDGKVLFQFYFYYVTEPPDKLYGMRFQGYMLGLGGVPIYEEFARVLHSRIIPAN